MIRPSNLSGPFLTAPGVSVYLRACRDDQPVKDSDSLLLLGKNYSSETEAQRAGNDLQQVLMLTLARVRRCRSGERAAKSVGERGGRPADPIDLSNIIRSGGLADVRQAIRTRVSGVRINTLAPDCIPPWLKTPAARWFRRLLRQR